MIPAAFDYQRAVSVEDAVAKLAAASGAGKLLAGGHSLVPAMKLRLAQPAVLIDIGRVEALTGIREQGGAIEIGACTTHHDIAASPLVREQAPALADAAAEIGDPQVRHRGTIGGSLAHADPSADYPAVLIALDARITVQGPGGSRTVAVAEFIQDLFTVDLRPDELIVSVAVSPARGSAYAKLHQRASHFAIVGVAAALEVTGGSVTKAVVAVTGATSRAVRLTGVESAVTGNAATAEHLAAATRGAGAGLADVNADLHASAEYRRAMVDVFARRALTGALARAAG